MDITALLSGAPDLLAKLWNKGWLGKTTAVVGTLALLVGGAWLGWSKWGVHPADAAPKPVLATPTPEIPARGPKAQIRITGAAHCCSPKGWPIVDDKPVQLSGVYTIFADKRGQFAHWVTSHGSYLECDSYDGITYRCLTPQRLDVAQALLLNGAARATFDAAPLAYRTAEEQAHKMGRAPRQ